MGVESGGTTHSLESGDLESFDPRRCNRCEERAGWLPGVFEHCPLCGGPTSGFADSGDVVGDPHWPQLSLPAEALPVVEPSTKFVLPSGTNFTFVRVPLRDRLVAIDGNSGRVWVYSRPGEDWRHLSLHNDEGPVTAPTYPQEDPTAMFGAVSVGGILVYPTAKRAVWIDTSPTGPARVEVSKWQPMGAPALLDGQVLMPVWESGGQIKLASRKPDETEWQIKDVAMSSRVQSADNPPWLARPVVEKYQVHWPGSDGLLFCDKNESAKWTHWQEGFVPVLGPPPLETRDGRFWQIGHSEDEGGTSGWAFALMDVLAKPECHSVEGTFFTAGRLCFCLDTQHLDRPWEDVSRNLQEYSLRDDSFLVPLAAIGARGALLLHLSDRSKPSELLHGDNKDLMVRGGLYLSTETSQLIDMRAGHLSYRSHQHPQVFVWGGRLFVYGPIDLELDSWPLDVASPEKPNPNSNGAAHG